jgi:triphosphoribosyl-dephospho-CoA synthase
VYSCRGQSRDGSRPSRSRHISTPDRPSAATILRDAVRAIPYPAWSRGWCAAVAGIIEATAAKPGNVHPGASFADLSHADLVAAAIAIAPAMQSAPHRPLGLTILEAVRAARVAADTNANLGIVLLTAPLAAVPDGEPLDAAAVARVLGRLDRDDAAAVYRAIAVGRPGGMGTADSWDVHGPAPDNILAAMQAAAGRDQIARLWSHGFEPLFAGAVADLGRSLAAGTGLCDAVVEAHLRQLARERDTLIARKHGPLAAAEVSAAAAAVLATPAANRPEALAAFDRSLRDPKRLNPGTTADIVAAALYLLLRSGRLRPFLEFDTPPCPAPSPHP